jgi:hypothetical protein
MAQQTDTTQAVSTNQQPVSDEMRVPLTVGCGVAGVLLYLAGAALAIWSYAVGGFDFADWKFWVGYGAMFASIVLFSWLLQWNRDLERVSPAIRRTLYSYNIFLVTVFLGAILVLGNILVTQYGHLVGLKASYDWTSQGVFTLSDVSVQQVKALQKPVKLIALYQRGTRSGVQLEQLFQLYAGAGKQVTFEFVDPFEDRIKVEDLFKKFPAAATREPTVIVTYGSDEQPAHKVVKDSEIMKASIAFDPFTGRGGGGEAEFHGENAITSAIRSLVEEKKTNVYFTQGHGEKDLNNTDQRDLEGIGLVKERLTELGIKAEPIDLVKKEIPDDASILVVAGPKSAFQPPEIQKIRDFMDRRDKENNRSGRLLVLFESPPELQRGAPLDAGLGELLASYKVQVKNNLVYDRASAIQRADQILVSLGSEAGTHQIVSPLKGFRALMIRAREIAPISDSPPPGMPGEPPGRLRATKLFSTTEAPLSWAQAEYESRTPRANDPDNTQGPVCVGVAVEEGGETPPPQFGPRHPPLKSTPLAVVLGDATCLSNTIISQFPENEDLFLNSINWLGGRITDIGIQPRTKKFEQLRLDNAGYYTIIFEPFFHLLAIAGFLSGLVWVVRADRYQLLWLPIGGTIVLLGLYAVVAGFLIGSLTTGPGRVTVMRLLMTCLVLWSIGLSFWLARMRPARAAEPA